MDLCVQGFWPEPSDILCFVRLGSQNISIDRNKWAAHLLLAILQLISTPFGQPCWIAQSGFSIYVFYLDFRLVTLSQIDRYQALVIHVFDEFFDLGPI